MHIRMSYRKHASAKQHEGTDAKLLIYPSAK